MKIYYRQPDEQPNPPEQLGVQRCYFKYLSIDRDAGSVMRQMHHHTGFEIHMVRMGEEIYETEGKSFCVAQGEYLVIPPRTPHRPARSAPGTQKCGITFSVKPGDMPTLFRELSACCRKGRITQGMEEAIAFILAEGEKGQALSTFLVGNRVMEILATMAREAGFLEAASSDAESQEDPRLSLARQYIRDNIARSLSCDEVAEYCHLSTRQLTRLFQCAEGLSPKRYIHRQRIACLEDMLSDHSLSLREISEKMHFSSEYYFNAFVKKHAGMTPGAYRKSIFPRKTEEKGGSGA